MDGVELLSRIKSDKRLTDITVFLLTGMPQGDKLEDICSDLGGSNVLHKPCPTSALYEACKTAATNREDSRYRRKFLG